MAGEARRRPVPREIPEKLRLTAAVLGCATRKELCARFRAASPATRFDLERANKWMQGRALPRDASVYDDWARAVGTARPGAWLAACTAAELAAELAALHGLPEAAPPREGAAGGAYAYLGGDYALLLAVLVALPGGPADPRCHGPAHRRGRAAGGGTPRRWAGARCGSRARRGWRRARSTSRPSRRRAGCRCS